MPSQTRPFILMTLQTHTVCIPAGRVPASRPLISVRRSCGAPTATRSEHPYHQPRTQIGCTHNPPEVGRERAAVEDGVHLAKRHHAVLATRVVDLVLAPAPEG